MERLEKKKKRIQKWMIQLETTTDRDRLCMLIKMP